MSAEDVLAKAKKRSTGDVLGAAKARKEPEAPEVERQSIPETAMHSGLQGVSFGMADEAQGLIGGAFEGGKVALEGLGLSEPEESLADPDITGERESLASPPPVTKGEGSNRKDALERILAGYKDTRDRERLAVHQGEADNPKTAFVSEMVGGALAPLPVKGGLAKQGLAAGGLFGFGKSEASDAGDMALDTLEGAGVGWATGKVMQGSGNWLKRIASERALRAAGAQKPDFNMLAKQSPDGNRMAEARRLGKRLLEQTDDDGKRVLGWLDNPEALSPKLAEATKETGEAIGGHIDSIQDGISLSRSPREAFPPLPPGAPEFAPVLGRPVSMTEIAKRLMAEADEAALQPGSKPYADALRKEAETLLQQAEARAAAGGYSSLTLPETEAAKRGLAGAVKKMSWLEKSTPPAEAKKQASRSFRKASEEVIEQMAGPDEKATFKALKDRYADLKTLRDIAQRGEISEAARMPMGLTEQNSMLAAIATGGAPVEQLAKAGGAGLLSRLTRGRGDAFAARAAELAAEVPGEAANKAAIQSLTPEAEERQRLFKLISNLGVGKKSK